MDMEGLVQKLPDLNCGANKSIRTFAEETLGQIIVLGDMKALLGKIVGKAKVEEVLAVTGYANTQTHDADTLISSSSIGSTSSRISSTNHTWDTRERAYKRHKNPITYVQSLQREWIREIGSDPEEDPFQQTKFRERVC